MVEMGVEQEGIMARGVMEQGHHLHQETDKMAPHHHQYLKVEMK